MCFDEEAHVLHSLITWCATSVCDFDWKGWRVLKLFSHSSTKLKEKPIKSNECIIYSSRFCFIYSFIPCFVSVCIIFLNNGCFPFNITTTAANCLLKTDANYDNTEATFSLLAFMFLLVKHVFSRQLTSLWLNTADAYFYVRTYKKHLFSFVCLN